MLSALLHDLVVLRAHELVAVLHPSSPARVPRGVQIVAAPLTPDELGELVRPVDAVWLIAPETGGILARLAELVECEGRSVLGSSYQAIRVAGDKYGLAQRLRAAGVRVPHTRLLEAGVDASRETEALGYPLVVKPAQGAGCEGVGLVAAPMELDAALDAARRVAGGAVLAQAYVPGTAASVALVADGTDAVPLAVNTQDVQPGASFSYRGGETPFAHPRAREAAEAARAACRAVPGLRGYLGVDLVLGENEVTVLEINPRLTTAYLGVRAALPINPAALALAACEGRLPPPFPAPCRRVRFDAAGRVYVLGHAG